MQIKIIYLVLLLAIYTFNPYLFTPILKPYISNTLGVIIFFQSISIFILWCYLGNTFWLNKLIVNVAFMIAGFTLLYLKIKFIPDKNETGEFFFIIPILLTISSVVGIILYVLWLPLSGILKNIIK